MSNIKIERLHKNDIEQADEFLHYIIKDTFIKNDIGYLKDEIEKEAAEKRKYLISDIKTKGRKHYFLIAKDDGTIIGTIESSPNDDFISDCTDGKLRNVTKIGTIYVHPNYQRQGIGSKLLDAIINELIKKNIHQFCIDSGFISAQKIWTHKFGAPTYHLKDFWSKGEDHMIWLVNI